MTAAAASTNRFSLQPRCSHKHTNTHTHSQFFDSLFRFAAAAVSVSGAAVVLPPLSRSLTLVIYRGNILSASLSFVFFFPSLLFSSPTLSFLPVRRLIVAERRVVFSRCFCGCCCCCCTTTGVQLFLMMTVFFQNSFLAFYFCTRTFLRLLRSS